MSILIGTGIWGFASWKSQKQGEIYQQESTASRLELANALNRVADSQTKLADSQSKLAVSQSKLEAHTDDKAMASRAIRTKLQQTLEQVSNGNVNELSTKFTLDYVRGADYDSANNEVLVSIFTKSEFIPYSGYKTLGNGLGWALATRPEILKDHPEVLDTLVGTDMLLLPTISFESESFPSEAVYDYVVNKIYENGGFVDQPYFDNLNHLFMVTSTSRRSSEYLFQLMRTKEDKQFILDNYILHDPNNKNDYWEELLRAEELATTQGAGVEK